MTNLFHARTRSPVHCTLIGTQQLRPTNAFQQFPNLMSPWQRCAPEAQNIPAVADSLSCSFLRGLLIPSTIAKYRLFEAYLQTNGKLCVDWLLGSQLDIETFHCQ